MDQDATNYVTSTSQNSVIKITISDIVTAKRR